MPTRRKRKPLYRSRRAGAITPEMANRGAVKNVNNRNRRLLRRSTKRPDRKTLPGMTKAQHYAFAAVIANAFIEGRNKLRIRVHRSYIWPKGWPLGYVVGREGDYKWLLIDTRKALVWMCNMGYNDLSFEELKEVRHLALSVYRDIERRIG